MKRALPILIPLIIALALGLYPTLISGMPFSTDGWPLIRNAELIIHNTPVALNSNIFDNYNNFWPAISLFGAALSQITNLSPIYTMAIGIPLAAAFTLPLFYLIVKKITENKKTALIATVLLATAFPYTVFAAGVTKQTFATPIYIALILIFLLRHDWKTTSLFLITAIALILTHHLTAFLTLGIIGSLTIASFVSQKSQQKKTNTNRSNILFVAILAILTTLYFAIYAYPRFKLTIALSDLVAVGAYQIIVISATIYLIHIARKESRLTTFLKCFLSFALIFSFFFLLTQISILPIAPTLPFYYFLFATPFILAIPVTIFALNQLHERKSFLLLPVFWILPIVAFAIYGLFANPPGGVSFGVRSINFILPPLLILVGTGLYRLFTAPKNVKTRKLAVILAAVIILSTVTINTYSLYATVSLQEPYLGYFWRYEPSEFQASDWLSINAHNQTVSGDNKVSYLVSGYFNENVTVLDGLRYLEGNGSEPQILYIYNQMYTNGYVLYEGTPITLPTNWTNQLTNYNIIYANSQVTIYAKR